MQPNMEPTNNEFMLDTGSVLLWIIHTFFLSGSIKTDRSPCAVIKVSFKYIPDADSAEKNDIRPFVLSCRVTTGCQINATSGIDTCAEDQVTERSTGDGSASSLSNSILRELRTDSP